MTAEPTKRCPLCTKFKTLDNFYLNKERAHLDGRGTYCKPCAAAKLRRWYLADPNRREKKRAYAKANIEKTRRWNRIKLDNLKDEFLDAYGRKCACCGEADKRFLSVEHTDNSGAEHRRRLQPNARRGGSTALVIRDLKRRGWPKEGIETLCFGCNFASFLYGKCPHRADREKNSGLEAIERTA